MKQVVPPQDEARNDYDVFAELSERWEEGGYERFTEGKSELEWLETFYNIAGQRGASQQVTLPPFAEFWQRNALIEMLENAASAQFIRFADFRRDPQAHPLKTDSGKIEIYPRGLLVTATRTVRGTRCGWSRMSGSVMPNRTSYSCFPPIRRTVCIVSLTTVRYVSSTR